MASRQERSDRSASNVLSALALAALGAWTHPALASSGVDALCDRSTVAPPSTEAPRNRLTLEVVDHGNAKAAGDVDIDDEVDAQSTRQLRPHTETILRRIFDESSPADTDVTPFADAESLGARLADEKSTDVEDASNPAGESPSPGQTATQLPGVSEDELLRFRKRMYRVDI